MTWPSFMAAPFMVPRAATICSAASTWRFSRAALAASSVRARFAVLVPSCRAAWPAARRPTLADRRTREVGILSFGLIRFQEYGRPRQRRGRNEGVPGLGATPPTASLFGLHLRPGHDVVAAVGPAHPRLRAAVVVAGEQDQRRLLAHGRAGPVALGIEAAPDADEGVVLPLLADRGGVGMAGQEVGLGRQLHQPVHDRGLEVRVGG